MKARSQVEKLRAEADRLERKNLLRLAKANGWTVTRLSPKDAQILRLRSQAAAALIELKRLSISDLDALDVLATELLFHIRRLNRDVLLNLDFAHKLTKKCPTWPACISADKEIQAQQTDLAKALQLGTESVLRYCLLDVCAEFEVFLRLSGRSVALA